MATNEGTRKTARTLIVLGSGGHTTEMVEIIRDLDKSKYSPRKYVVAESDNTSKSKIQTIEDNSAGSGDNYTFYEILRSRKVKQNYFTSIFTTIGSIIMCIPLIWNYRPDLVLCNGPGVCIPVCLIAYLFKIVRVIPNCKIVFIESFCRVKSLSLSGKILLNFYNITDLFVVQWPELKNINKKVNYFGRLT